MAKQLFANNVSTPIMEFLTASDTTISVSSTSRFPSLGTGDWIMATIVPQGGQGTPEIVKITAIVGNTLTVVRGQEGTTAQAFLFGALIELRVTKGSLEWLRDHPNVVNVQTDFGAIADWNGTTGTNNTVAFQQAVDYIKTVKGKVIFPSGRYLIQDEFGTDQLNASDLANDVELYFEPGCEIHYAPLSAPISGQAAIVLEGNNVAITGSLLLTSDRILNWAGDLPAQRTPYYAGIVIGGKSNRRLTQTLAHFKTGVLVDGVTVQHFNLPISVYAAGDAIVRNCIVEDDTDTGILIDDCTSNIEIYGNIVRRSGDDCFFARHYATSAWNAAGNYIGTVLLHHNYLYDTFAKSFGFGGFADVDAHDNFSKNTWYAASNIELDVWADNNKRIKIHDNLFIDSARAYLPAHPTVASRLPPTDTTVANAFHCFNGGVIKFEDIEFYNNTIVNPDQNGVSIGDSKRVSIRGNRFIAGRTTKASVNRDTAGSGIRTEGCQDVSIDGGNHIYGNGSQSWSWCYELTGDAASQRLRIFGNAQEQFVSSLFRGISSTVEAQTSYSGFAFYGTASWAPGAMADGTGTSIDVSVPGASLGDLVSITFTQDLQGIILTGNVRAANVVSVRAQNETGGPVSLTAGVLKALITKRN